MCNKTNNTNRNDDLSVSGHDATYTGDKISYLITSVKKEKVGE